MGLNFREWIKAVDPERFHFALGVYQAAAAMKGPYENPRQFSIGLVEDDGSTTEFRLNDIPENRGMLAVKKEFPDPNEFQCLSFRIMSLSKVLRDRKLLKKGLIRRSDDGDIEVHDSVINALARAPFRKSGSLDTLAFHALVTAEYTRIEQED